MAGCGGEKKRTCGGSEGAEEAKAAGPCPADPCTPPEAPVCGGRSAGAGSPSGALAWFEDMIEHCHEYAVRADAAGRPIVGICCEYAPRELILAAGGVPVCLCGGSAEMVPASAEDLPSNLCPLIKSTYGYHVRKANPFLELAKLVVAEATCDGKKKMYELLARTRPVHVLDLPQKADDPDALEHWTRELAKLRSELERRFEVRVTDEKIREATLLMNRERALRRALAELMKADSPPLSGRQLLQLKSSISCIPEDLAQYERALGELGSKQGTPEMASRVRVLLTGVPVPHGAERIVDLIEGHGGLIVCAENCTGVKPILEDVDASAPDPLRALAEKYLRLHCSVMTPNDRRLQWLARLAREYRAECIVELVWQACLTYDVESWLVRRLAGEELGIPYLQIQTDYSPSDSARIAVRVEALFETVRGRAACGRAGSPRGERARSGTEARGSCR